MPMLAAFLIAMPPKEPLSLRIEAPKAVNAEQPFRVKVWLFNRSAGPVVAIVPTVLNSNLGADFRGALWLGERRVPTKWAGRWTGQWISPQIYAAEAFATIPPGGQIAVESIEYAQEYASGVEPGLGEVEKARLKPIPAGRYVYRAEWKVRSELPAIAPAYGFGPPKMTPEAEKLYADAWKGIVQAETPITIRSKPAED